MAYATLQDLIDAFGEGELVGLTDRGDVATGVIDTDVVDQALGDAAALINGYLAGRYRLPVSETPALVNGLAKSIAFYKLHRFDAPDLVTAEYKDALARLKDIAQGTIKLDIAGKELPGSGGSGVQITDRERPLEASKMTGFI